MQRDDRRDAVLLDKMKDAKSNEDFFASMNQ